MIGYQHLYEQFIKSGNAFQVYENGHLIFASNKPMLAPLLEYVEVLAPHHKQVVVFDKIMGNAAALLCIKVDCKEVYSPLGSEMAIKTLERYGIAYHITEIVPHIQRPGTTEICPMEKLSTGKEPEEFYLIVKLKKPEVAG